MSSETELCTDKKITQMNQTLHILQTKKDKRRRIERDKMRVKQK